MSTTSHRGVKLRLPSKKDLFAFTIIMVKEEEKNEEIEAPIGGNAGDANEESLKPDTAAAVTVVDVKNGDEEVVDKQIKMKVAADAPWSERMWEVFTTFWYVELWY